MASCYIGRLFDSPAEDRRPCLGQLRQGRLWHISLCTLLNHPLTFPSHPSTVANLNAKHLVKRSYLRLSVPRKNSLRLTLTLRLLLPPDEDSLTYTAIAVAPKALLLTLIHETCAILI